MTNAHTVARALRTRTLPMIVAPVAAGAALAYAHGFDFAWGWFAVTIVGAVALQLGSNALGDVADARSGADKLARVDRGAIATDPGLIESGQMSAREMLSLIAALYGDEFGLIVVGGWLTLVYVVLTVEVAFKVFPVWTLAAVATAIPVAASWARAFRDSIVQNCLNLLGATLGAAVLTTMTIGLSLLFWR